jgi:hypothetical protein
VTATERDNVDRDNVDRDNVDRDSVDRCRSMHLPLDTGGLKHRRPETLSA